MVKIALLIGVSEYGDPNLALSAPPNDVKAMKEVLKNPNLGGFCEVRELINPDLEQMQADITWLFNSRRKKDLLLLFFSGHGMNDDCNNLYFTTRNTNKNNFQSSAMRANFVAERSNMSVARRQVMILDCCHSGAFNNGWQAKSVDAHVDDIRRELGAEGRAVLTSCTATQKSFERKGSELSLYTHYLVEGIQTGASDTNNDGKILVGELHNYATKKVQDERPDQKPDIITLDRQGYEIQLAQAPINPEAQYRKSVERVSSDGKISETGREALKTHKENYGISDDKALEIESQVLKPFQKRLDNLKTYEKLFKKNAEKQYPLAKKDGDDLKFLQEVYGLRDEDVEPIEEKIINNIKKSPEEAYDLTNEDIKAIEEEIVHKHEGVKDENVPHSPQNPDTSQQRKLHLGLRSIKKNALQIISLFVLPVTWLIVSSIPEKPESKLYDILQIETLETPDIPQDNLLGQPSFSQGEQPFFAKANDNRDNGIAAFTKNDYSNAILFFEKAIKANRNDPESQIYLNNAIALKKGKPVTLAAVVPLDNGIAAEILRGVAQAQDSFNKRAKDRLLKIVIAKDGSDPNQAKQVAKKLIKNPNIIGVIGHNTSKATEAALSEYEKGGGIAIISPTSTSTSLKSSVFFRTVTNDQKIGEKLAIYAISQKYNKAVIFNNPNDTYSNSIMQAFQESFETKGDRVLQEQIDLTTLGLNPNDEVAKIYSNSNNNQRNAVIFFPNKENVPMVVGIAQSAKKQEFLGAEKLPLLGADVLYNPTTLREGKAVEGLVLAVSWFAEEPNSKKFADAANTRWEEQVSWRTAASYDATQAFIKALSSDNPSRETVLENLKSIKLEANETSGNPLQFSNDGERQSQEPVLVKVVKDSNGFQFKLVD